MVRRIATAPRTRRHDRRVRVPGPLRAGQDQVHDAGAELPPAVLVRRALAAGVYDSAEEYLTEIRDFQRSVVDKLISLGCDYIQLDAPNYGSLCDPDTRAAMRAAGRDPDAELAFDAELDSSLFDGLSGVTTALHVCRGNGPAAPGTRRAATARSPPRCSPSWPSDRLLLEYDSDRAGGFEPLADVRDGTVVVLGLLTTKSDQLESEDDVIARINEATGYKPLDELALSHAVRVRVGAGRQPGHARSAAGQAGNGGQARAPHLARPARRGRGVVTSSPGGRPRRRR